MPSLTPRLRPLSCLRFLAVAALLGAGLAHAAPPDRTPDAFGFEAQDGVEPGVVVTSNTIRLTGYDASASVTAGPGLEYSIDGKAFKSKGGSLAPGQTLAVRHTSSSQPGGVVKSHVTVGGVTGYFQTRTRSNNTAPQAFDDGAITDEDRLVVVDVLANDVDDGRIDPGSVTIVSESHGVATANGQGQVSFLPDANYFGTDAGFTYTVRDEAGLESNVATVSVTVRPVNDAPVADDASASGDEDAAIGGTVTGSDVDGDALSFAKASEPAHGQATVNADGSFSYVPAPNFAGTDSFTFTASDGADTSAPATVTITVNDQPEAVVSVGDVSVAEDAGTMTFTVTLSRAPDTAVTLHYATADGTATAGSDYAAVSGELVFEGEALSQAVAVPVSDDAYHEGNETLALALAATQGADSLDPASDLEATGTITDNDAEDTTLLRIGAARRSLTPTQPQIDGIEEERAFGAGTHLQKFNLGGFGTDVGQNLPDPAGEIPAQATSTEPASRRVFTDQAGEEENTYLRLFAIEDNDGQAVVFVMIDAIGAGNLVQAGVKDAIVAAAAAQGVTVLPENILFGQTHSHTAADLQGLWGGVPRDWVQNILFKAAGDAATEAFASRKRAHLSFKQGYTTEFNNYRRPRIDPNADADGTITLLQASAEDGTPIGSILQYNAHPTSVGDDNHPRTPHGEYIWGATRWIETHGGGTTLYFNGPIADASPSGSRPGCVNPETGSGDPSGAAFGNVRCRGEGIADYLLHPGNVISGHELAPTLELRSTQVVLPITNPLFLATAGAGSFNRYYNFTELPVDQIPGLTPEQVADLPQLAPVAITTVSRVTLGGAEAGLEIVTIPGETTNTMGNYIRGLAKTNVMLTGLTHNSFGYILPEEEFSYVDQEGDNGVILPFTGYEENVSLGPLTAPLLRSQGWNRLFDVLPAKDVPPAVTGCVDGAYSAACVATVVENRLNILINSVESCIENGPGGAGCPFGEAGFPDVIPGAGGVDEPALDTRLIASSADAQLRGCDMLDTSECLFPFPNDWFTVPAAKGSPQGTDHQGTGRRVNLNPLAMPRNLEGKPIDPTEWNRNDGFSPGALIVTYVPGIGTVKDANHNPIGPITGAVPITDLPRYQDADAPILVVDADTGLRHPIYAEIDLNAGYLLPMQGLGPRPDKMPALLIRPATNFIEGHRYVVVLRNLKNDYGQPLWAGPAFSACRDHALEELAAMPTVQARCTELAAKVFPVVKQALGVPAGASLANHKELYLAWDFTVASRHNDTARIVAMRDDAFRNVLGDTALSEPGQPGYPGGRAPTYVVTKVTENPDGASGKTVRRIQGTITVPSYVVPADPSPLDASPEFYSFRKALRENNADVLETIRQQCANSPVDDADPVGVICDVFDPSTGASASAPPNRLHYVPDASSAASCDADAAQLAGGCAQQARYGDGLPDRNPVGELTTTFTCNIPRIAVSGKGSMAAATPADVNPVRPTLYGHGLLGGQGEGNGQASDFGNVYGLMTCMTDWFGFASGDIGNVASALVDLSNFPVIPDGAQQGVLNMLFLARAATHPDGFAADPNFQVGGRPVFDRREVFYHGNSQGGIMGGVVVAASKDINRGVLGVPGMNYSTLLARSTDFALYSVPLYLSYQDDLERPLVMSLMQMLWDRAENDGYAGSLTDNSAMGGPDNAVLLQPALGDHQVTMWSAEVMARTIGAKLDRHRIRPGRHPDLDASEYFGLTQVDYAAGEHWAGSALVPYDQMLDPATGTEHWNSQNDSRCDNNRTAPPPIGNVPPNREVLFGAGAPFEAEADSFNRDAGSDPHECPRRDPQARCQQSHFLLRTPDAGSGDTGPELVPVDHIAVFGPSADTSQGCPAVVITGAPRTSGTPAGPSVFEQLFRR